MENIKWALDPLTGNAVELLTAEQYDEMCSIRSEQGAELRNEQFFETRGYDDAIIQEQWEKERGVISFEDAFAQSLGYADADDRKLQEDDIYRRLSHAAQ